MRELKLDTGIVTFKINDVCEINFNPTDMAFAERILNVFEELDKKQEEYRARISETDNNMDFFTVARQLDGEMRAMVDDALGAEVCGPLFGDMNIYAMSDGLPLWANLILALVDEVDSGITRENKQMDARIKKYTGKYRRKSNK